MTVTIKFSLLLVSTLCSISYCSSRKIPRVGAGLSESCNETLLCDASKGLSCIYSQCQCLIGEGYAYDVSKESCVGGVSSPCNYPWDCTDNATCENFLCSCSTGYTQTLSKRCAKTNGETCDKNEDCNQDRHLICGASTKKCECNGTALFFEEDTAFCSSKIGQNCDPHTDAHGFPTGRTKNKCTKSALCKKNGNATPNADPTYKCECEEGLEAENSVLCKAVTKGSAGTLQIFSAPFLILFGIVYLF